MRVPFYHLNAFADRLFEGNPAGVCVLDNWLAAETMQAIAAENALTATAFLRREEAGFGLRWFSPKIELDLCGHGTLAASYVVLNHIDPGADAVRFYTQRAELSVTRMDDLLAMDFPVQHLDPCEPPLALVKALGRAPKEVFEGRSYVAVFEDEAEIAALAPDMDLLATLERPAVVATAPGRQSDIASRNFAPAKGIPEDPVTGSAHAQIVPYWSRVLGKKEIHARQLSQRGGTLWCEDRGERVRVAGRVAFYMAGEIRLPE